MANYVYTLIHTVTGTFLVFEKLEIAYFFGEADGERGDVYPEGTPIVNGPGSVCLPGGGSKGRWSDNSIIQNARREFIEECGRTIEFDDDTDEVEIPYSHRIQKFEHNKSTKYAGYYIEVSDQDLHSIYGFLRDTSLAERASAARAIRRGTITEYRQICEELPHAPYDDELCDVFCWNLNRDAHKIAALKGTEASGWFYNIIMNLPEAPAE